MQSGGTARHLASCHSRARSGHARARTAETVAVPMRPETETQTPLRRTGWPPIDCMQGSWVERALGRPRSCQHGALQLSSGRHRPGPRLAETLNDHILTRTKPPYSAHAFTIAFLNTRTRQVQRHALTSASAAFEYRSARRRGARPATCTRSRSRHRGPGQSSISPSLHLAPLSISASTRRLPPATECTGGPRAKSHQISDLRQISGPHVSHRLSSRAALRHEQEVWPLRNVVLDHGAHLRRDRHG